LGEAMTSHPATHVLKLRQDQKQLPTELSIFQLDIFIKYQKEIEEKKKELRIAHKQDWQDSVKFLEGQTQHRIGTLADGKSELIHLAIKGDQVALLNQGSTMTFPSIKSSSTSIDEVVEEPSSKKQQNLLKDDEKKTNGGMKKISKKYLKKTRKSKY
jgi:Fe2+ transport system protein B